MLTKSALCETCVLFNTACTQLKMTEFSDLSSTQPRPLQNYKRTLFYTADRSLHQLELLLQHVNISVPFKFSACKQPSVPVCFFFFFWSERLTTLL